MIDYIINILKRIFNNEGIRTEPDPFEEEVTKEVKKQEKKPAKKAKKTVKKSKGKKK